MKILHKICLIACVAVASNGMSQDFHLSQYDAAALNTNPALTGMFEGKHRFHLHYRTQWSAVATRPFTTGVFAWDMRLGEKWSIGVQALNYHAGAGAYNAAQLMPSFSYSFALDKRKYHKITLGAQVGGFHKTFDFEQLTWGNQYVPTAEGGMFDQGLSSNETYNRTEVFQWDANAGLVYFFGRPGSRFNPFVGAAAFHLNTPNESFYDDKRLPMRYLGHAGMRIGINERLSVIPKLYYQFQEEAQEITFSALAHLYFKKADFYLLFGGTYRNQDAAIADFGIKTGALEFRMSYDFNISTLKVASSGRGATELSLTYILFKNESNPIPTCPRL